MPEGNKPKWFLNIKHGERFVKVGAIWENEKGNLTMKVDVPLCVNDALFGFKPIPKE